MAKYERIVAFRIVDIETIRKIQRHFGMPEKMTVNKECPVMLDDDEMIEMLKEVERRGFIDIREKEIFNFPEV